MSSLLMLFVVLLTSIVDCGSRRRSKSYRSRYGKYGYDRWDKCPNIKGFFSYDPKSPCGPQHWHKKYPNCGGDTQSPIDIQTDKTRCGEDDGYERVYYKPSGKSKGIFENNGHAPNFKVKKGDHSNILILGDDERNDDDGTRYVFKGLHFHIGKRRSSYGSEHTVNKKGYKGEIHLVHNREKAKRTNTGDDDKENGHEKKYLVVGVFFDVFDDCGSYADKLISKYVTKIPEYLDETKRAEVRPILMLPEDGKYYYYVGSKTTPGCYPGFLWIIFKTPTTVCKKNYKVLKDLETWEAGNPPLSKFGNNRPIQRYAVDDVKMNFGKRCRGTK
ncbi:Carbonic anhydrase 12 [Mizuhopecten yessoensis]|uniref:Carbonic anhydrase n=2 Tax=Mizuhopecten yessoensis TaxID=6573 RepID=A0A210QN23_MIZYE|nr:Carbonic anhydrase 12 [Mizuhopecten yessoensis]